MNKESQEATGFRAGRALLYVGDMVSIDSGYDGFMRVVKGADGYWLVDQPNQPSISSPIRDFQLNCNLPYQYQIVDPCDPYAEPTVKIYCSQCDETISGEIDGWTGKIAWNVNCAQHEEIGDEIESTCQLCASDLGRGEAKQRHQAEVKAYLQEKQQALGIDQYKVFDLWPYFGDKLEVDTWFAVNGEKVKQLAEVLNRSFNSDAETMEVN